jgi:hypothetical protein
MLGVSEYKERRLRLSTTRRHIDTWDDSEDMLGYFRPFAALFVLVGLGQAYFSTILHETQPPSAAKVDKLADSDKDLLDIQIELEGSAAFYRNGR